MGLPVSGPAATFLINSSAFSSNQAFTSIFFLHSDTMKGDSLTPPNLSP